MTFVCDLHEWRNPTAFTFPLTHVLVSLIMGLHRDLALDTKETQGQKGCFWDKSHSTDFFVTWKGLWPSLRLLLRPLKTVWVVCTGARAAISLLCLFSKVEVSKLQSKQQLRPSKSLLLKWQWVYLSSNSGIKWKITILWFCFADRSCLLPGPHTELLWAPREGSLATATRDGQ